MAVATVRLMSRRGGILVCLAACVAGAAMAEEESVLVTPTKLSDSLEIAPEYPADEQPCLEELRRCCGCPDWHRYLIFDSLFLQRSNQTGAKPIVQTLDDRTLITTRDLDPSVGTGFRTVYGVLATDRIGWEIGYLGLWGMFGSAAANGPDNLRTPEPLAFAVNNFGDAHDARATYLSSLNMAEFNLFRYAAGARCRRVCGRDAGGCCGDGDGTCVRNCNYLTALGGFVWAGLDEQAGLDMTCCPTNETASYNVRSSTNYFGAQIGMQGRREWNRWAVEGWWKTALCGVTASQSSEPIVGSLYGSRDAQSASDGGVGFIGNLNASLVYRLTNVWGLRCGYNMLWLTNAALAPSQWDFSDNAASGTGINDNGTVFLHGANLGLEARW